MTFEKIIKHNTEVIKDGEINCLIVLEKIKSVNSFVKVQTVKFINGFIILLSNFFYAIKLLFEDAYLI